MRKKRPSRSKRLSASGGVGSFVKTEITGAKIGQSVEYHVVVKNTGNVPLKFGTLTDANCELITGGASELAPGAETTFSCTHTLAAVGPYSNEASIEGSEGAGTKTSNKVTVSVTEEASYTIEKLQRVQGEPNFTKSEVTGKTGQLLEYEIVVKNTGNVALKFGALTDAKCEGVSPGGPTELAPNDRRVVHVLPRARQRRLLHQRSHDRRQQQHRHENLERGDREKRLRAVLHGRKAPAPRRSRPLHHRDPERRSRRDRRIPGDRQEHR